VLPFTVSCSSSLARRSANSYVSTALLVRICHCVRPIHLAVTRIEITAAYAALAASSTRASSSLAAQRSDPIGHAVQVAPSAVDPASAQAS
jgi:hypothetical protein